MSKSKIVRNTEELQVPVSVTNISDANIFAKHSVNTAMEPPSTVHFMVHGSTQNNLYFDWPENNNGYSFVETALANGHATFAIDRLGSGWSTKPDSELVTLDGTIDVLHQLAQMLRDGSLGNYKKVIYHGISFSTAYGWLLADRFPDDIDAYVLCGLLHYTRQKWIDEVFSEFLCPACTDPKWSHLDCGYLTTKPKKRREYFYVESNANESTLILEDELRDVFSETLGKQSVSLVYDVVNKTSAVPIDSAAGKSIDKPVLVVLGEYDQTACSQDGTEEDGIMASDGTNVVKAFEQQYYPLTDITVYIQPDSGHAINLHKNSKEQFDYVMDWTRSHNF